MSLRKRLEGLEGRARAEPEDRSGVRARMKAHLDRAAELRRGGATVENNAELRAMSEAVEHRRRVIRGEGGR